MGRTFWCTFGIPNYRICVKSLYRIRNSSHSQTFWIQMSSTLELHASWTSGRNSRVERTNERVQFCAEKHEPSASKICARQLIVYCLSNSARRAHRLRLRAESDFSMIYQAMTRIRSCPSALPLFIFLFSSFFLLWCAAAGRDKLFWRSAGYVSDLNTPKFF